MYQSQPDIATRIPFIPKLSIFKCLIIIAISDLFGTILTLVRRDSMTDISTAHGGLIFIHALANVVSGRGTMRKRVGLDIGWAYGVAVQVSRQMLVRRVSCENVVKRWKVKVSSVQSKHIQNLYYRYLSYRQYTVRRGYPE